MFLRIQFKLKKRALTIPSPWYDLPTISPVKDVVSSFSPSNGGVLPFSFFSPSSLMVLWYVRQHCTTLSDFNEHGIKYRFINSYNTATVHGTLNMLICIYWILHAPPQFINGCHFFWKKNFQIAICHYTNTFVDWVYGGGRIYIIEELKRKDDYCITIICCSFYISLQKILIEY